MKAGIRTFLLADTNISAAISGIYSFPAPQDATFATKPYILLSRISEEPEDLITGTLDIYDEPWQFDILGSTDKAIEAVKELVVTRMKSGNRVAMGNYWVYSVHLNFVRDGSELEDIGGEGTVHRKIMEYQFKRNRDSQ